MIKSTMRAGSVAACAVGMLAAPCAAQPCTDQWLAAPTPIAGVDNTVLCALEWDPDGFGPAPSEVIVGGQFTIAGASAASSIARWDGERLQPLGAGVARAVGSEPVVPGSASVAALLLFDFDGEGPEPAKLVVGGSFSTAGGSPAKRVAIWDGSTWTPLEAVVDNGGNGVSELAAFDPDGEGPRPLSIIASGNVDLAPSNGGFRHIFFWDGSQWRLLGGGINGGSGSGGGIFAMTVWDPDGSGPALPQLIVAGRFVSAGGVPVSNIASWNGTTWSAMGAGFSSAVRALTTWDPDGNGPIAELLVAGGDFTGNNGGSPPPILASWNGTTWQSFPGALDQNVEALTAWDRDGCGPLPATLVAGMGGGGSNLGLRNLTQWTGSAWQTLGGGTQGGGAVIALGTWDRDGLGPGLSDLIAGGQFLGVGDVSARGLASWNGTQWTPASVGSTNYPFVMLSWKPDPASAEPAQLIVGGSFTSIGNTPAKSIAAWDGVGFTQLGTGVTESRFGPASLPSVEALCAWDPDGAGPLGSSLVIGGDFGKLGTLSASCIARWNGSSWSAFASGVENKVEDLTVFDHDGSAATPDLLIAGGFFQRAGSTIVNGITWWNGTAWQPFGTGVLGGGLEALTVWKRPSPGGTQNVLVAGGTFTSIDGVAAADIAAWDGLAWQPLGAGFPASGNRVYELAVWDPDGSGPANELLVAGGSLTFGLGTLIDGIGTWDGSAWTPLTLNNQFNISLVEAITTWDPDGPGPLHELLVASYNQTSIGGVAARNIAAWNGATWAPFGSGINVRPAELASWDPDGSGPTRPWLLASGSFTTAGGAASPWMARWGSAPATWAAPASGSFDQPSNWECGVTPSRFDRVIVDATAAGYAPGGAFTLAMPAGASNESIDAEAMRVRTDTVTLDLNARTVALSFDNGREDPSLRVGDLAGQAATLVVRNTSASPAEFTARTVVIGDASTTTPLVRALRIEGSSTDFRATSDTVIGRRGASAELEASDGGGVTLEGPLVAGEEAGSSGVLRVRGAGSVLAHGLAGRTAVLGGRGAGSLHIGGSGADAGATVTTLARLDALGVGSQPGSSGTVTISGPGSSWSIDAQRITFGRAGTTTITVDQSALLDTDSIEGVQVGQFPQAASRVSIAGGSIWSEQTGPIRIGDAASVYVEEGSVVRGRAIEVQAGGLLHGAGLVAPSTVSPLSLVNVGTIAPAVDPQDSPSATEFIIDADLLMCDVDCLPLGACCLPDGTCSDTTGAACFAQGGTFFPYLTCASCPCGRPDGLTQPSSGTIALDLTSPTTVDRVTVTRSATLTGTLIVERDPAFTGAVTQPLTLLAASGGISGFFDVAFLPSTGQPGTFFVASTQPLPGPRGSSARAGDAVVLTIETLAAQINTSANDVDNLGGRPSSAVIGDFDGVNGPDLAVVIPDASNPTGANGSLTILYNNGSSNGVWNGWTAGTVQYPVGRNPSGIAAGHVDAAGAPGVREDLVISNAADDSVIVLRNNNLTGVNQQFVSPQTFAVGDEPTSVVAADFDADGLADVATSNRQSSTVSILQNRGVAGAWLGLGQTPGANRVDLSLGAGSEPLDIAAARLNRPIGATPDAPELVTANAGDSTISIIDNVEGSPTWAARFNFPPVPKRPVGPYPTTINPINPDEDKFDDDIVTTNALGDSVSIIRNDIAGAGLPISLRPHVELPVGDDPSSLAEVDLDGDGDGELAVIATVNAARVVRVLRNDTTTQGEFTFSLDNDIEAGTTPLLLLAADVDLAGPTLREDLIVLNDQTLLARGVTQPARSTVVLAAPPACLGDATNDGVVNFADITAVLASFGSVYGTPPATGPGDADGNGIVNFSDVASVLANFGTACS
jgi:T5SS/PEP-CTERM-associated repeat protein